MSPLEADGSPGGQPITPWQDFDQQKVIQAVKERYGELSPADEWERQGLGLTYPQGLVYFDQHRFRVLVSGRRFGKCIDSYTRILLTDGTYKTADIIAIGDEIVSLDETDGTFKPDRVVAVASNGVKPVLRVRTRCGSVVATLNHPFYVNGRWVPAGDIRPGDLIAVPGRLPHAEGASELAPHEVDFLAIWLAEGRGYGVTNADMAIVDVLRSAIRAFGPDMDIYDYKPNQPGVQWRISQGPISRAKGAGRGHKSTNPVRLFLERLGLWSCDSKTKFIPDAVWRLPKQQLARFLSLFFACDGSFPKGQVGRLEIGLANERLVHELAQLLLRFGVWGNIYYKLHRAVSKITGKQFESWTWTTSDSDCVIRFAADIGCVWKTEALNRAVNLAIVSRGNCNSYLPISYIDYMFCLPEFEGLVSSRAVVVPYAIPDKLRVDLNSWRKQTPERISRLRYAKLRSYIDDEFDNLDRDLRWVEVQDVTEEAPTETYDIETERYHTFLANGIVSHNTHLLMHELSRAGQNLGGGNIAYIAPLKFQTIDKKWIAGSNETTMELNLKNKATIRIYGADNYDSLRGQGYDFIAFDETADCPEAIWWEVVFPALADRQGEAIFCGTPKGLNSWLYEIYLMETKEPRRWRSFTFSTIEGGNVPPEEVETARRQMSQYSYAQEFEASFSNPIGRCFQNFTRSAHVSKQARDHGGDILVGMDFNVSPFSCAIGSLHPGPTGPVLHFWDELVMLGASTQTAIEELKRRFPNRQITVYPDASGRQRKTSAITGVTDFTLLREAGFGIVAAGKNPGVKDRINAANTAFRNAKGETAVLIHPDCTAMIRAFDGLTYGDDGKPDKNSSRGLDHMADAATYLIWYALRPLQGKSLTVRRLGGY
jgi:intein/homing endonuclease